MVLLMAMVILSSVDAAMITTERSEDVDEDADRLRRDGGGR